MKKILAITVIIALSSVLLGCTNKNDIEEELESQRESEELLNDEEAEILHAEDPEFQEDYLRELSDALENQYLDESIALIDEIESSKDPANIKGSCDAIESSSTCIEYYGSFWANEEAMLNCSDQGTFSTNPCPNDYAGGCNTGVGTMADMVAWMYLRGGGEMDEESIGYAQMACDATLASNWISQ